MIRYDLLLASFFIPILSLTGCASSEATRFYLLTTLPLVETAAPSATAAQSIIVGIGPVELPSYLDRSQIVTRIGPHELDLAEFQQWAEPLHENIARVLAENLGVLLPTDRLVYYPWPSGITMNYQIAVRIVRFDLTAGDESILVARWRILDDKGETLHPETLSIYRTRPKELDYPAIIAAMNQTLTDLSREIAGAIDRLP